MARRASALRIAGTVVLAVLILVVALPALTGRPILSYPVSGSMEPTMGPFDVFLVDPLAFDLRVGDIIVFQSVTRGGPAVHRIVGGDARTGWYTQGDANPEADQTAGEPVVTPDRILGRVVTLPGGAPILAPNLGIPVTEAKIEMTKLAENAGGTANLLALGLLAIAAALAVPAWSARVPPPPRAQPSLRWRRALRRALPRGVLGRHVGLALLVLLLAATAWAAHAARTPLYTTLVVVDEPTAADSVRAALPGHSLDREVRVGSLGFLPTLILLEPGTPGIQQERVVGHAAAWTTTTLRTREIAGHARGLQEDTILVHRYPALLPDDVTLALHETAPGAPYFALAGALALVGYGWLRVIRALHVPVGRWLGIREDWL